jgi:hypothetical protein
MYGGAWSSICVALTSGIFDAGGAVGGEMSRGSPRGGTFFLCMNESTASASWASSSRSSDAPPSPCSCRTGTTERTAVTTETNYVYRCL